MCRTLCVRYQNVFLNVSVLIGKVVVFIVFVEIGSVLGAPASKTTLRVYLSQNLCVYQLSFRFFSVYDV